MPWKWLGIRSAHHKLTFLGVKSHSVLSSFILCSECFDSGSGSSISYIRGMTLGETLNATEACQLCMKARLISIFCDIIFEGCYCMFAMLK